MNIVNVSESPAITQYVVVTQQGDINETITNTVYVTDNFSNETTLVEVARGIQGFTGPPGKDGIIFDILPIASGGTNNTSFATNKILYFDGSKLASSNYNISDIATNGIVAGTGMVIVNQDGSIIINSNLGSGLRASGNKIVVDFDLIDSRILQQVNITAGSGLVFSNSSYHILSSQDIQSSENSIVLSPTGTAGTYSKVTTDNKGRVISGTSLTQSDITTALGYTPWHPGNDGSTSELDADKLDGFHGSYYRNLQNITGILNDASFPKYISQGSYTKVSFSNQGVITGVSNNIYSEITGSLGYRPVNSNSDSIGSLIVNGSIFSGNIIKLYDNIPILALNHSNILYNEPRGFRFLYGNSVNNPKTGILAYYPGSNTLRISAETSDLIITDRLASGLYASLNNNNTFDGINTFLDNIYVNMLNITGLNINTTGLINNLNADYLDNKHGSFYLNAANLTGTINASGYPVNITNLSGTINYIPKFDNRTNNPSRSIKDSIISEQDGNVVIHEGNLLVGLDNTAYTGIGLNGILVGTNNRLENFNNSVAFGSGHVVSGNNAFAANFAGNVRHDFSFTMGKNAETWSENQMVFGIFREPTGIDSGAGHGQYSTIGLSKYGEMPSFVPLDPEYIYIPKNKAFLYNLDVIMTKLGASGMASFRFESGIIRNITRRSPLNLSVEENLTQIVKPATKTTIYNDSYIRDYSLVLENNQSIQNATIKIVDNPHISEPSYINIENLNTNVAVNYKPISLTGTYLHNESSPEIILNLDKPRTSGYFVQDQEDYKISLYTYKHNAVSGSEIDIRFYDGIRNVPTNDSYIVTDIINDNIIKASLPLEQGFISGLIGPSSVKVLLPNPQNNYANIDTIYIRYINGNTVTYSDTYTLGDRLSNTYNYNEYKVFELINVDPDLVILGAYENNNVLICPASNNSGHCDIIAKRKFNCSYTHPSDISKYTVAKAVYGQGASNTSTGYSNVYITGLSYNQNSLPSDYTVWSNASLTGQIYSNETAYLEFAPYILTTYQTDSNYYDTGVSGIVIDAAYIDIHGEYNKNLNSAPLEMAQLFIQQINTDDINQYVTTSGYSFDPSQIFIPLNFNLLNGNYSGTIQLVESGSYKSGNHPSNGFYDVLFYDENNAIIHSVIKYSNPVVKSGYAITGFVDIYAIPKTVQISVSNISPLFDRNKNNEYVYMDFNNVSLSNENLLIVGDSDIPNTSSLTLNKKYFYPENPSGINGGGRICANKNHGLNVDSVNDTIGIVPIKFMPYHSGCTKDAIYSVSGIVGDRVTINNYANHIRNESGAPMYYGEYNGYGSGGSGEYLTLSGPVQTIGIFLNDTLSKQEININDTIEILNYNSYGNLGYFIVPTGYGNTSNDISTTKFLIPISGLSNPLGITYDNAFYESVGTIRYTKISSGLCNIPQNNIFFNTDIGYEDIYNRWGINYSGQNIQTPKLVQYIADGYSVSCQPDQCCISFSGSSLSSTNFNENDTVYISFDRPYERLNDTYYISKKFTNNKYSVSKRLDSLPNYGSLVFPFSGYAEVIPFHNRNNLVDKSPNYNNNFYSPNITLLREDPLTDQPNYLAQITGSRLQYFDFLTNRQLHAIEINISGSVSNTGFKISQGIPTSNPYLLKLNRFDGDNVNFNGKNFNILINSIDSLQIDSLYWKYTNINDNWTYNVGINNFEPITNSSLEIFEDREWILKVRTINGIYSSGLQELCPTVEVFGVKNYDVINTSFTKFDNTNIDGYWDIDILCSPISTGIRQIRVGAQDYGSTVTKSFNVISYPRLKVDNISTTVYANNNSVWYNLIEIYGVNNTEYNNIGLSVANGDVSYVDWESDINAFTVLVSGSASLSNGILRPEYTIEYDNQSITSSGTVICTGSIPVNFTTHGFSTNPIVFTPTCNSYMIPIIVPNYNNNISNLSISLDNIQAVSTEVGYSSSLKRYLVKVYLNSNTNFGLYASTFNFTYNTNQSTAINKNIVFADFLRLDKTELLEPIKTLKNTQWTTELNIAGGDGTYNNIYSSTLNILNKPSYGYYDFNDVTEKFDLIKYNSNQSYNTGILRHRVYSTGLSNTFDEYPFRQTGLYTFDIYLEDSKQRSSGTVTMLVSDVSQILNLNNNIYGYFNKPISFNCDSNTAAQIQKNENAEIDGQLTNIKRYNPNTNVYNHNFVTPNISGIWDSKIDFTEVASSPDASYSTTLIQPACKGILDDNVYVSAKLDLLEISNSYINIPIKISNLSEFINIQAGTAWNISFNTCYGVQDENYPPTIYISGAPTTCTGVMSSVNNEQIPNGCIKTRTFNKNTKCWFFEFEGEPLCNPLFGQYNVNIQAIDMVDNIVVGRDDGLTRIIYGELSPHPAPSFTFNSVVSNTFPDCGSLLIEWSASVSSRDRCPVFTGLSGIRFDGRIPGGLSLELTKLIYNDGSVNHYPNNPNDYILASTANSLNYTFNALNVSGVSGTISGAINEFGLNSTISGLSFDYRSANGVSTQSFSDTSNEISNRIQYAVVYFPDSGYYRSYITPSNQDLRVNLGQSKVILNPPVLESIQYTGPFFNNSPSSAPYSGVFFTSDTDNSIITITGINRNITQSITQYLNNISPDTTTDIFIKFSDENASENKTYKIYRRNTSPSTIEIINENINRTFVNRTGCLFAIPSFVVGINGTFGSPQPTVSIDVDTNKKLLGCGYLNSQDPSRLEGYIRPSYISYIPLINDTQTYPEVNPTTVNELHKTLALEPIDGICCNHATNGVVFKNCYESGIIRVSGIIVPKPVLEITDIDSFEFLYNQQSIALSVRLAYGISSSIRDNLSNQRQDKINGSNTSGSFYIYRESGPELLASEEPGSVGNSRVITFYRSSTSGDILKLHLERDSDIFPTTDQFRIPLVNIDYYGVYNGISPDETSIPNDRNVFPPYVPIIFNDLNLVSGTPFNFSGIIAGGFVPDASYTFSENSNKNHCVNSWQYSNYPPIYSGILNKALFNSYSGYYRRLGTQSIGSDTPVLIGTYGCNANNLFSINDLVYIDSLATGVTILGTGNYDTFGIGCSGILVGLESNSDTDGYADLSKFMTYQKIGSRLQLSPKYNNIILSDRINLLTTGTNSVFVQSKLSPTGYMVVSDQNINYWYADVFPFSSISDLPNSGYIIPYKVVSNNIKTSLAPTAKKGQWLMSISGDNTYSLDYDYKYQILTMDNTGLPTVTGLNWTPRKFSQTYDLHVMKQGNEIFEIYQNNSIVNQISVTPYLSSNWTTSFHIKNGIRPLQYNYPLIEINNNFCGFSYSVSYNDCLDMLKIDMTGSIPQSEAPCLRLSNRYGYKEYNLNFS